MKNKGKIPSFKNGGMPSVLLYIIIFVVIIMDSAVAQSQVRSDMIEVTAAVPKDSPPYYFVDESGKPKGFAIDVMDRIAEMAGLKVAYLVDNSWTDAAEAVKSGRADMIPNIGITANRKAYFDYTAPVETFAISIFVRKDTNYIKGVDDLAGHKVAAIKYNIAVILLQDHEGVDLEVFNDPREAVFELLSGHVDAVVYPAPVFMKIVREAKVDHRIKIAGKPLKEIKRAMAVSKGNMNLLDRLNGAVNRFVGTNDYQHIYLKWFGKPQPFWTISRIILAMSGLFLVLFTAMALWRYNSIVKLNRELLLNIADRKQAEEKYEMMFEMAKDAVFMSDETGKFVDVNQMACKSLGYSKEELLNLGNKEIDADPRGYEAFLKIRNGPGEKATFGVNQRRKDGTFLHVEITGNFFSSGGQRIALAIARDITERKKMELELIRLSDAFRMSIDSIVISDLDGKITDVNEGALKMYGTNDKADLIGRSSFDIFVLEDREKAFELAKEVMEKEYVKNQEYHLLIKDGSRIPVELSVSLMKGKEGEPIGSVTVTKDITERKQAEEKIRTLSSAVEQSIDGMAICDLETKLTYMNNAFARMHGYSPEEMVGMKFVDLFKNQELDKYTNGLNKVKTLGSWTCEIEHIRKDGTSYPAFMSVNLLKDAEGRPTGILAVVKDISEQKKLEEQFRQAQKMEAVGTLASGVAHDFNNLLTVIIGNAQLALMKVIKDESLRIGIEETKKAGDKAASLTRQLLAFSRKQIITPRVLDLNELLTGIKKMLARLIGEEIEFLTVLEPELWKAHADPGQMEQVIMNLAVNARDAISTCADRAAGRPTGGNLTIETVNADLNEKYFREHGIKETPGHYVMLTISDTGSGMDKETREHIFEPFFTTKGVGKGTGLGLSTVYGIVKQNNGFVWVYSEPGQGTTFKVYLPRVEGNVEAEEKEQTPVIELDGSETILIVEDDDSLRKLVQNALWQHGYKVLDAENGEDALRVCQAHEGPIDLMITDVVMPKMGGKEAAERLQPLYPQMKVIYMSGYTDNAIVKHGVLAPELNFFQKPFTPESLARKVREMLNYEN